MHYVILTSSREHTIETPLLSSIPVYEQTFLNIDCTC